LTGFGCTCVASILTTNIDGIWQVFVANSDCGELDFKDGTIMSLVTPLKDHSSTDVPSKDPNMNRAATQTSLISKGWIQAVALVMVFGFFDGTARLLHLQG
jgi:hypothetical protein